MPYCTASYAGGRLSVTRHVLEELDAPAVAGFLREAMVRTEAAAPTVAIAANVPTAKELGRVWGELEDSRKRKVAIQRQDPDTITPSEIFQSRIESDALNEAILRLGDLPTFKRRYPMHAAAIGSATASQLGTAPALVMLVWDNPHHADLPCPVTKTTHKSNRTYMILSGLTASLRCTDPACHDAVVVKRIKKWSGLRGQLLPVADAGDHVFSTDTTVYSAVDGFSYLVGDPSIQTLKRKKGAAAPKAKAKRPRTA